MGTNADLGVWQVFLTHSRNKVLSIVSENLSCDVPRNSAKIVLIFDPLFGAQCLQIHTQTESVGCRCFGDVVQRSSDCAAASCCNGDWVIRSCHRNSFGFSVCVQPWSAFHAWHSDGRILDGPKTNSSHPGRRQSNLAVAEWRRQATGGYRPAAAAATPCFTLHSSTHSPTTTYWRRHWITTTASAYSSCKLTKVSLVIATGRRTAQYNATLTTWYVCLSSVNNISLHTVDCHSR